MCNACENSVSRQASHNQNGVYQAKVYMVAGKTANQIIRARRLQQENKENIPPTLTREEAFRLALDAVEESIAQCDISKEEGRDAAKH